MLDKIGDTLSSWFWALFEKFTTFLLGLLPDSLSDGWAALGDMFGPTAQYLAWILGLDVIPWIIVGAYITRFLIRRLPVIG